MLGDKMTSDRAQAVEAWQDNQRLRDELDALLARERELTEALQRAVFIAEHLFQMVSVEDWRATGGDDGQGHYEGDYRAEQTRDELKELGELAVLNSEEQRPKLHCGYCGYVGWTIEHYGRVTHKESCPVRTDPWCQTHPKGCPFTGEEPK